MVAHRSAQGILNALGTDTTLFCRGTKPLRNSKAFDHTVVDTLVKEIQKSGLKLSPGSTPLSVVKEADGTLTLTLTSGEQHKGFDCILMAIGRTPCTKNLGLAELGVQTNDEGFIVVNKYEETNVKDIYALGDVTNTG